MVIFKVRVYHRPSHQHETFYFLTIPNRTEVATELLKLPLNRPNRSADYISGLVENVRKFKMPNAEVAKGGGSGVTQWHDGSGHAGYLDIEGIIVNENHHQPLEPENMVTV